MRLVRLLLVFVLVLTLGQAAVGQESKGSDQKPNAAPQLQNPPTQPHQIVPGSHVVGTFKITPEDMWAMNTDCLVMHTIHVARDGKDSDSTHVVNVTNCTPAKRFQMKSAVAVPRQK